MDWLDFLILIVVLGLFINEAASYLVAARDSIEQHRPMDI